MMWQWLKQRFTKQSAVDNPVLDVAMQDATRPVQTIMAAAKPAAKKEPFSIEDAPDHGHNPYDKR